MRILATLTMTILTMTVLLLASIASAAGTTQVSDQVPDQATAPADAKEQKNQNPLAKRNAAAKALKAKIEKQNPERTGKAQQQEVQQEVPR